MAQRASALRPQWQVPEYDFTAQYILVVDDLFLHYAATTVGHRSVTLNPPLVPSVTLQGFARYFSCRF